MDEVILQGPGRGTGGRGIGVGADVTSGNATSLQPPRDAKIATTRRNNSSHLDDASITPSAEYKTHQHSNKTRQQRHHKQGQKQGMPEKKTYQSDPKHKDHFNEMLAYTRSLYSG